MLGTWSQAVAWLRDVRDHHSRFLIDRPCHSELRASRVHEGGLHTCVGCEDGIVEGGCVGAPLGPRLGVLLGSKLGNVLGP